MGTWTLESINHRTETFDTPELFGNHYIVTFRLRYTRSTFGSFTEMPMLDWHEVIMMNEHHKGEHWTFTTNMYAHNPTSRTLQVWPRRYYAAYDTAAKLSDATMKGSSKLLDKNGQPVGIDILGPGVTSPQEKADVVRDYLKRRGGVMVIEIDDIPSINMPRGGEHKERLLIFNCGLVGSSLRTKAIQYLNVNHALPRMSWTRRFDLSHTLTGLKTTGLRVVTAPPGVASPRSQPFFPGEYK